MVKKRLTPSLTIVQKHRVLQPLPSTSTWRPGQQAGEEAQAAAGGTAGTARGADQAAAAAARDVVGPCPGVCGRFARTGPQNCWAPQKISPIARVEYRMYFVRPIDCCASQEVRSTAVLVLFFLIQPAAWEFLISPSFQSAPAAWRWCYCSSDICSATVFIGRGQREGHDGGSCRSVGTYFLVSYTHGHIF
jgi:hypothetical protein